MSAKQKTILLITEWGDPRFLRGVAGYARAAGWHLALDCIYGHELPWGWQGDGCLASAGRPDIAEFTQSLGIPVVELYYPQEGRTFPTIHEDNTAIGAMAADYFLNRGFKHFACYRTDTGVFSNDRLDGYRQALGQRGYPVTELLWRGKRTKKAAQWSERKSWLVRELDKLPKPVALFCIDDRMALNVIEACEEGGLSVPHDVSVMGVGNLNLAGECSRVPLSSVCIDFEAFGYRAAELLDGVLDGRAAPEESVLVQPIGIEERRSTDTLALCDPAGQKAVRFMLEHFTEPINSAIAARAAGLTARQLTYITKQEFGIGPAKLLEAIRVRKARQLLLATDYTIEHVASDSGLANRVRLQRIFQRRFKTSPAAWRRAHEDTDAAAIPFDLNG